MTAAITGSVAGLHPLVLFGVSLLLTLLLFTVEFAMVLHYGPKRAARMVERDARRIFEEYMRPGIRAEVAEVAQGIGALEADLHGHLETLASQVRGVAQVVPPPAAVAVAVRDALVQASAGKPDPLEVMRSGIREELAASTEGVRVAMREELEAAMEKLSAQEGAMEVEEAAQVMSRRGVDARMTFAAQEEQFQAAVLKAAGQNGPVAVAALEQAKAAFPATYKVMVRQGPAAVPVFFKQAGLKATVGGGDGFADGGGYL